MVRATLRPSYLLGAVLALVHVVAAAIVLTLELSLPGAAGLNLAIAGSLLRAVFRDALLISKSSVRAIEVRDRTAAAVQRRDGVWREGRVLGTTYVTPALTVLNLKLPNERSRRHVLILPDSLDPEEFRALRVLLRWAHPAGR
ncbi:MAG: protein YgfX [Burkholderiales bacterium]